MSDIQPLAFTQLIILFGIVAVYVATEVGHCCGIGLDDWMYQLHAYLGLGSLYVIFSTLTAWKVLWR